MFHAGFAGELARATSEEHRVGSGRRVLSSGDRERLAAREESERSERAFEHALSAAGAAVLLATVLLGVGAAVLLGIGVALAIAITRLRSSSPSADLRPPSDPDLRWAGWRRVEPDREYLRGRAT